MALSLRDDCDAARLKLSARQSDNADQVRRLLSRCNEVRDSSDFECAAAHKLRMSGLAGLAFAAIVRSSYGSTVQT